MKSVLILDANQRSALATTRSLGKHDISITTADHTHSALAGSSRYSSAYFQYPDPSFQQNNFIDFISKLIKSQDIEMILPMTELTTTLLMENRHKFSNIVLPFPSLETLNSVSDKCILMQTANKLDIPFPKTWYEDDPNKLSVPLETLQYPIVLKPGKSWLLNDGNWQHTMVRFADTPEAAQQILSSDPAFSSHAFMLQECVQGAGQGVFAIYNKGKAVAFFSHKRIREKPPWGGVSVLSESIKIDPVLLDYSRKLLDSAKWHGIAMVEFKVSDNNVPYLMEINTRFWGSLQLAIDAGVDFPWLLYQISSDQPVTPPENYKVNIRLRWLLGDLDTLYISIKSKKISLLNKIKALLNFLNPFSLKTRHEVNRWTDLKPFWYELKGYLNDLF